MRGRLVRDDVHLRGLGTVQQGGQDLGGVAHESHGQRTPLRLRSQHLRECRVQVRLDLIEVALGLAAAQARLVHIDDEAGAAVECDGQRLRAAHPAAAGGDGQSAGERPAEALVRDRAERLDVPWRIPCVAM